MVEGWPTVLWAHIEVRSQGGKGTTDNYQVPVGVLLERPEGLPDSAYIGSVEAPTGPRFLFDALAYEPTALLIAAKITPTSSGASTARLESGEQSNTSLVLDEKFILKVFRKLEPGINPDVEVTEALGAHGFTDVPVPVDVWREGPTDLAVLRRYERSRGDAWTLALASLDEIMTRRCPPREGKFDMVGDSRTLGNTVARLHVALAETFGFAPAVGSDWADAMSSQLQRVAGGLLDAVRIEVIFDRLRAAPDLGMGIRIHGDLHLGQILQLPRGPMVLDFEGEPERPVAERRRPSSPLRDVAGMTRSFQYAAAVTIRQLSRADDEQRVLASAWAERNMNAFLAGYAEVDEVHPLLPRARQSRDALLSVFELDKAVYEVAYEISHRPDFVDVPVSAVSRLIDADPPLPEFPPES